MNNWGYHIKRLRQIKGMTQAELSTRSGLTRSHISRIESADFKSSTQRTFERLAYGFGITVNALLEEIRGTRIAAHQETPEDLLQRLKLATPVSIPIYTDYPIHAGSLMEPVEFVYRARPKAAKSNIEGYICNGACLSPKIAEGDIIIVDRDGAIEHGDIVACVLDGKLALGQLRKIGDDLWLEKNDGRIKLEECLMAAPVIEVIKRLK